MKRGEGGFTLIEVMIAVAIMGIIMPVITMTTMTLVTNSQKAADHNIVLRQVQNAGYWISRDVQMAENVTLTDPSGFPLTLDIPVDMDENNDIRVDYLFDGNKLERQVFDASGMTSQILIAEHIHVADTIFSTLDPETYKLTIKASKGEVVVETSYEVRKRLTG